MDRERITVEIVDRWPPQEIVALYRAGGWWKEEYDPAGIPALVEGSHAFAVAVDEKGHAVGMGRAITDRHSDAYIQDVVVKDENRGEGIGRMIVEKLLERLGEDGLGWIGLIAEDGSEEFYEGLGFKRMKGTPMLFEGGR